MWQFGNYFLRKIFMTFDSAARKLQGYEIFTRISTIVGLRNRFGTKYVWLPERKDDNDDLLNLDRVASLPLLCHIHPKLLSSSHGIYYFLGTSAHPHTE